MKPAPRQLSAPCAPELAALVSVLGAAAKESTLFNPGKASYNGQSGLSPMFKEQGRILSQ